MKLWTSDELRRIGVFSTTTSTSTTSAMPSARWWIASTSTSSGPMPNTRTHPEFGTLMRNPDDKTNGIAIGTGETFCFEHGEVEFGHWEQAEGT